MLSETSPRSCVLPLCISHCWRPSLSGQSGVSSETSASMLECPRENSSPGQGAMDGRRPSSITAPSPFLKLKAVCLVSFFVKYYRSISRWMVTSAQLSCCGPRWLIRWRTTRWGSHQVFNSSQRGLKFPLCSANEKIGSSIVLKACSRIEKANITTQNCCQSSSQIFGFFFSFFYEAYASQGARS